MRSLRDVEKKKIGRVASHDNLRKSIEFSREAATIKKEFSSFCRLISHDVLSQSKWRRWRRIAREFVTNRGRANTFAAITSAWFPPHISTRDNHRKWRGNVDCRLFSRRAWFYLEYEDSSRSKRNNRFFVPKVYTRNAHGIRGHVEAYVAAFDKYWNLALEDCFEVWSRKVKRKAPALGTIVLLKLIP